MYRQCDDCKRKFKTSNMLDRYLENHPHKAIYCPNKFCNSKFSHIITKREYDSK